MVFNRQSHFLLTYRRTNNKNFMNYLVVHFVLDSGVAFLGDRLSDTLVSWEGDERLGAFAEQKDIRGSRGEGMSGRVFDVDDVKRSRVSLSGLNGTNSTNVLTADDVADVTGLKFDPVGDL